MGQSATHPDCCLQTQTCLCWVYSSKSPETSTHLHRVQVTRTYHNPVIASSSNISISSTCENKWTAVVWWCEKSCGEHFYQSQCFIEHKTKTSVCICADLIINVQNVTEYEIISTISGICLNVVLSHLFFVHFHQQHSNKCQSSLFSLPALLRSIDPEKPSYTRSAWSR